jgi:putative hemolysin
VEIFLLFILIVINGLLAMSEVALLTSKRSKLSAMAAQGKKSAQMALRISEDPTEFLSTIQIGITSIGLLSGIVGEAIFAGPLSLWLQTLGVQEQVADIGATIFVVVVITYIAITIGELVPKRIGQTKPEVIASFVAAPMLFLSKISRPFVVILSVTTNTVLRLFGIGRHHETTVTEDEIDAILEEGLVAGLIEDQERELVKNVFRLDDRPLGSLMVPRTEIVFVDINDPDKESFDLISQSVRSKIPVCDGDLDNIIGVLSAKTALATVARGEKLSLRDNLEPAMFVPETLTGMDLLEQFKQTRTHIAFVVDEYGGLEGLVTLQDIFDSLVGEIATDGEEVTISVQRDDGSWLFEGDTPIPEFKDALSIDEVPGEFKGRYHTLSGLVLLVLERMPVIGDSVEIEGWKLEVVDMDGKRIDKILATRIP